MPLWQSLRNISALAKKAGLWTVGSASKVAFLHSFRNFIRFSRKPAAVAIVTSLRYEFAFFVLTIAFKLDLFVLDRVGRGLALST